MKKQKRKLKCSEQAMEEDGTKIAVKQEREIIQKEIHCLTLKAYKAMLTLRMKE
jgi:hypothetical protein